MEPVDNPGRQPLAHNGKNNNFPVNDICSDCKYKSVHPEQRSAGIDFFVFVNRQSYITDSSVGYPLLDQDRDGGSENDRTEQQIDPYVRKRRINEHLKEIDGYGSYCDDKHGSKRADLAQIIDREHKKNSISKP